MASSPRPAPGRAPARVVFRPACTSATPTTTSSSSPCTIAGPDVLTPWTSGAAEGAALAPRNPVSSRTKEPSTTCRAPQPLQPYRHNEKYDHARQRDQWPPGRGESRHQEIQRSGEEQHRDEELWTRPICHHAGPGRPMTEAPFLSTLAYDATSIPAAYART